MKLASFAVAALLAGALSVTACGRKGDPLKPAEIKKEQKSE